MTLITGPAQRALSLTLSPLPQAGEGNVWSRAARDAVILIASMRGALKWE